MKELDELIPEKVVAVSYTENELCNIEHSVNELHTLYSASW
jgi:hypothetical protein